MRLSQDAEQGSLHHRLRSLDTLMNITQPPKLPFLEFLGWQTADVYRLTQLEMLASYERGWRYRHIANLSACELAFIEQLAFDRKSFHCYKNLAIAEAFRSKLIDGIDLLAIDLGLDKTSRTITESGDEIFPFM